LNQFNVDEELLARHENGVLWLTLNRVEKGNAIPYYVRDRLIEHFTDAQLNVGVRCIVLTAAGDRHFCTGADLSVSNPPLPKPEGAPDFVTGTATAMMRKGFPKLVQTICNTEKPVILALNGTAAGGGAALVLAADLVIAADTARIAQVFLKRGLVPDAGTTWLLPSLIGMHKAKELLFFGDDLSAADAERLGIVNKVVPAAELPGAAKEWAERLASGPTKAIGWTKKLLHDTLEMTRAHQMEEEALLVEMNAGTRDSSEGVASFRERRQPEWKGW
jgi:2-(1,2-epoxy-1,2-dihydrophenyl)acetyl-CoA isomerase